MFHMPAAAIVIVLLPQLVMMQPRGSMMPLRVLGAPLLQSPTLRATTSAVASRLGMPHCARTLPAPRHPPG